MTAPLVAQAPAKVNLTLRVLGRRADGLHEIESLVVFAALADEVRLTPDLPLRLAVVGPLHAACGPVADNLVLKAAHALAARISGLRLGQFTLIKRIPVAAGLGGGSSDAAAALRLLAQLNGLGLGDERIHDAAREVGADVPVCLDPRPRIMHGIGEMLSGPLALPPLAVVLVNPRIDVATRDVFAALLSLPRGRHPLASEPQIPSDRPGLIAYLSLHSNDLEPAAISLQPVIVDVLAALRALPQCRVARMSGSGATCFALCDSTQAANEGARNLRATHPQWWIEETLLAGG